MRAHLKINVSIQLDAAPESLAQHYAGVIAVADLAEGKRVMEMLDNHIGQTFVQMGVTRVSGDHKPDLALARGGDPEPEPSDDFVRLHIQELQALGDRLVEALEAPWASVQGGGLLTWMMRCSPERRIELAHELLKGTVCEVSEEDARGGRCWCGSKHRE